MKILNFGSINIDYVYRVPRFAKPGEALNSLSYAVLAGGKGANQTVALTRAGASIYHAGKIGPEGVWVKDKLTAIGVDTSHIQISDTPTGHAIIHVTEKGQNMITVFSGANHTVTKQEIDLVLSQFKEGDILIVQNEISNVEYLLNRAQEIKMKVFFIQHQSAKALLITLCIRLIICF